MRRLHKPMAFFIRTFALFLWHETQHVPVSLCDFSKVPKKAVPPLSGFCFGSGSSFRFASLLLFSPWCPHGSLSFPISQRPASFLLIPPPFSQVASPPFDERPPTLASCDSLRQFFPCFYPPLLPRRLFFLPTGTPSTQAHVSLFGRGPNDILFLPDQPRNTNPFPLFAPARLAPFSASCTFSEAIAYLAKPLRSDGFLFPCATSSISRQAVDPSPPSVWLI